MTTLRHVLWIGGPSAGKTTAATRLARRHGLRWYSSDAHTWEHRDTAIRAGHEAATRWEAMTHEERAASNPAELIELNLDFERGPMVLDDLRRLPSAPLVVADGSTVLPELVAQGHAERDRAVWLLTTFERHRAFHGKKDVGHLVEYRWLVAQEIARQAAEYDVNVLRVDDTVGIEEALAAVEELFAGALAEGPRAETLEERRALLRYANEAVVTQAATSPDRGRRATRQRSCGSSSASAATRSAPRPSCSRSPTTRRASPRTTDAWACPRTDGQAGGRVIYQRARVNADAA